MTLIPHKKSIQFGIPSLSALLVIGMLIVPSSLLAESGIEDATVKIITTKMKPDYFNPWSSGGSNSVIGSGSILEGKQILTNAHVVENHTFIQVRRQGDPNIYQARVLNIDHSVDLALLTVDDSKFFSDVEPLHLGNLPELQQEVRVYGFPIGGDTLSITKGIISRIEHQMYVHSMEHFLAVQIDAAINPGNSGGPAIVNGRIVGIATQGIEGSQNIGYIVPAPIIKHFLKGIRKSEYQGFPGLGIEVQPLENSDQRKYYHMSSDQSGSVVTRICAGSAAEGKLKINDVLLTADGHAIANDGSVEFRPKEWTDFNYYVQNHQIGESIEFQIIREGKVEPITIILSKMKRNYSLIQKEFDKSPRYYIFGGLVFIPLTINYLEEWGPDWEQNAPPNLLSQPNFHCQSEAGEEIVNLLKVLPDRANQGYGDLYGMVITKVNGVKIVNLRDLKRIVEESPEDAFVVFETSDGQQIVLNKKKATESNERIMATYHIIQTSYLGSNQEGTPSISKVIVHH